MRGRNRFILLVSIMITVSVGAASITMWILYNTAIDVQRELLVETARSQSCLIEAVARFDKKYSGIYPFKSTEATLRKIRDAHKKYRGFGQTGEFTLARRERDKIVFLLSHRHYDLDEPKPVDFNSNLAEPMRLALSGKSGTIIGLDYRGKTVLAAYEPVRELSLGIVVKIDIGEIRRPFIHAAFMVSGLVLLFVLLGASLFYLISSPVVRILEEQNKKLRQNNLELADENEQRQKAEKSLLEIRERLTRAQQIARIGDFTWDVETGEVTWSDALFHLLGFDPSETINYTRVTQEIHHPDDLQRIKEWFDKCVNSEEEEISPNEYRVRRKNGETIYVRTMGIIKYEEGQSPKVFATVQDITESKQVEDELKQSEALFRALFENMPSGAVVYRPINEGRDFVFTDFNAAAEEIEKIKREDVIGKKVTEAFPGVKDFGLLDVMQRVWETGQEEYLPESLYRDRLNSGSYRENWVYRLPSGDIVVLYNDVSDRKRTSEEREKLEGQLSDALEMAHLGHWEYDVINDLFTFNDHFYRIFKTTVEEVGGYQMSLAEYASRFVHPDDNHFIMGVVRESIETSDPEFYRQLEHRILYANGNVGYINVRLFIVKDEEGKTVRTYGVSQDIAELKRGEKALRASEEKYRTLFENMMNGFALHKIIVDETGVPIDFVFLEANEAFERLTGLHRKVIIGKRATEVLSGIENDEADWIGIYGEVALTGKDKSFEQYSEALGRYYNVLAFSSQKNHFATIFEDITARKLAEQNILRSEDRLNSLFNNLFDALLVTDMNGKVQFANPAACKLFAKKCDQLIGDSFNFPTVLNERFEIAVNTPDGIRHAEAQTTETDWSGRTAYLISLRDVTDRKRAEEEKESLEQQLQQSQKLESIGQLAGGIAHDFNNMLSVILGYGDDLLDDLHPTDPMHESVKEIVEAGKRSAALTRQLLAFSRRQTLQPRVLSLNDLIRNLEKMLRRLIGEDIELIVQLAEELDYVQVDPGQIEQVIMNLAVNARDAMPKGGELLIITQNVELDDQYASSHVGVVPGRHVLLAISDTGCGMDRKTLTRVFDPFFTTKEKGKGTGLGLSTVYGIIKQSGGGVWVYSEPGQGTSFKIYLPCTGDTRLAEKIHQDESSIDGKGELVLVVEDETALRKLTERFLESLNYKVMSAANGGEALLLVEEKENVPDVILTDVVMPGMSGKVLVDRLYKKLPDLKVIFMSGYTDDAIAHHGILDNGVPFIQKPFNKKDLGRLLKDILVID